jgi:prolyl-tRNA synthetase
MKGVPLRVELGPRDAAQSQVVFARRDQPGKAGKSAVPLAGLGQAASDTLAAIQSNMLEQATRFRDDNTHQVQDLEGLKSAASDGWALAWWCGDVACETDIKERVRAEAGIPITTRCIPLEQPGGTGTCVGCGKPATEQAIFGRAY